MNQYTVYRNIDDLLQC